MSQWTSVRIMYDLNKCYTKKNKHIYEYEDSFEYLGVTQLLETARKSMMLDGESIFELGSEKSVNIHFYPHYCESMFYKGGSLDVDNRGQLVMFGELRDCERCQFIEALNNYIQQLRNFGISVSNGLVSIK